MPATLKHRWSIANNYLAGITTGDWIRLLRENRFAVDPAYWHRAAFITLVSGMNSLLPQEGGAACSATGSPRPTIQPPLFILGHWRSGTTHLHNLLARDTPQFAFAEHLSGRQSPHVPLHRGEPTPGALPGWSRRRGRWMTWNSSFQVAAGGRVRALPDEPALALSGHQFSAERGRIRALPHIPRRAAGGNRRSGKTRSSGSSKNSPSNTSARCVLKSPPHTARIRLLLEMFPDARFVHIHRDPYQVFQSCRHYYDTATWFSYLQRPDLDRHRRPDHPPLHPAARRVLRRARPDSRRADSMKSVSTTWNAIPCRTMRKLYQQLDLERIRCLRARSSRTTSIPSQPTGRTSSRHWSRPIREKIATRWQRSFDEWNYPI